VYEKGEKRFKHEHNDNYPRIEYDQRRPKRWVGKCPSNISGSLRTTLLNEAIPAPLGDREISYVKKVYVVHQGAIYEAQTSDHGTSYHGYPYRGKLSRVLLRSLREMAIRKGCLDEFERWAKEYIEIHG
jgi:hypothetical protein